jgi:predicted  nucleic acid-binding Zn-ribbon protein
MSFKNPVVKEINQKVQKVVSERDSLKADVKSLQDRIATLESTIQQERSALEELEQKYKVLKLAKSLEGEKTESGTDLKLKINEMVREIDKCIALLNK